MTPKKVFFTLLLLTVAVMSNRLLAQHNAGNNGKVLMVASNPSVSKQTGWPIGVWYAELTHPYWVFSEAGYTVDIASLNGGEIKFDGFSDPEDASKYAAFDYISLGFKKDDSKMALTKNTLKLSAVNPADYKAIFVCGGQGPMYTMYNNTAIQKFFADFMQQVSQVQPFAMAPAFFYKPNCPMANFWWKEKNGPALPAAKSNMPTTMWGNKFNLFVLKMRLAKCPTVSL